MARDAVLGDELSPWGSHQLDIDCTLHTRASLLGVTRYNIQPVFHASLEAFCERHWMAEREQQYEYICNVITVREKEKQRRYLQPVFTSVEKQQKRKSWSESFLGTKTPPILPTTTTAVLLSQLTAPTIPARHHLSPQKPSCCYFHHDRTPSASRTRTTQHCHGPCS